LSDDDATIENDFKALFSYSNHYYETYGREVVFEDFQASAPSSNQEAMIADAAPYNTMGNFYWGKVGIAVLTLALMNSSWGCSLAGQNAVVRVIYKMGQVGVLPKAFARLHPTCKSPHIAIITMTALSFVVTIILGAWLGPIEGFGLLATMISVGTILVYALGMIAVPIFYRREHPDEINVVYTYVFPIVGSYTMRMMTPLKKANYSLPANKNCPGTPQTL